MAIFAKHRLIARRAAYWALLGAVSGSVAWCLAALYYRYFSAGPPFYYLDFVPSPPSSPLLILILPGLTFGSVASLVLWRQGLARGRQVAGLVAVSIFAWNAGIFVPYFLDANRSWGVLFGGLVWSAVQTGGTATIFPFARRIGLWTALVAAGGAAVWLGGSTFSPGYQRSLFLFFLWPGWYAIHAAILSTALPTGKD